MKDRRQIGGVAGFMICTGLLLIFLASSGCTTVNHSDTDSGYTWQTIALTDVRSGTTFSISELKDRPILIQTFTITCPICMQQQAEISKLNASGEVPFVMIGLDIDPNGNADTLRAYTQSKEYYGLYARSPSELTRALVDQFGVLVLSPAQAPLILICPDGTARILSPGVKSDDELKKVLSQGCPA
jgi:thiol-disulfide isomerase/thioredoxin